ncbi:MAG: chitobiase/beta-hexosaminidase C-terminal domain-containing protein [Bacteroidetes bacterium]|nr:chitobiase/beta-hexosaminidase C-terminal domain-containing protein [Bacteroidota bacterium]
MIPRIRIILSRINFSVCCILGLFLFVPGEGFANWLQVIGRMHPLLLHFPIALIFIYAFWKIISPNSNQIIVEDNPNADDILLIGSLSASISALMGLILSQDGSYTADGLFWHEWLGSVTAFGSYFWYTSRNYITNSGALHRIAPVIMLVSVTLSGHFGAGITHGTNFIMAPLTQNEPEEEVIFDSARVFTHLVRPILKEKCFACHNSRKAKGELVMETSESLRSGGESGMLWDTLNTDQSLILQRIFLPEDDEEHMPPIEKNQLSDYEIEVIEEWVIDGAHFEKLATSYPPEHPLYRLTAEKFLAAEEANKYAFNEADSELIESLNSSNRSVAKIAGNSPALAVSFFSGQEFSLDHVRDLQKIGEQIVQFNAAKTHLTDDALKLIGEFKNLEKLNLNFTDISGNGISSLSGLKKLNEIALSGIALNVSELQVLGDLDELNKVFIWSTGLSSSDIIELKSRFPLIEIETGFDATEVVIPLPTPLIRNKKKIFSENEDLVVDHYISDVELRYTLDSSEPDSVSSPLYNNDLTLSGNIVFKVKAFKEGWKSSETVSKTFLQSSFNPSEVSLLTEPDKKYSGNGSETLFDHEEGTFYHADGNWIGYLGRPFEALLTLQGTPMPGSITISCLNSIGSSIMPPRTIELWYGNDPEKLKLWKKESIEMPSAYSPQDFAFYSYDLPSTSYEYLKLIIQPVSKLPAWHSNIGKPGWVFIDELLLN